MSLSYQELIKIPILSSNLRFTESDFLIWKSENFFKLLWGNLFEYYKNKSLTKCILIGLVKRWMPSCYTGRG